MSGNKKRTFDCSNAMYARALKTIPLASQTFSKSAMNFVRGASPLFLARGHGCRVWDVDGNEYIDYILGLMPVVLGYCDPDVDAAIRTQLERGIIFSLASELEAELAECLVRLIPCAEMVRFGKNGSDATSAAVRLARAHTGRDRVAVCGYHGWHDWYIGTTTRNLGVPAAVRDLSVAFTYGDLGGVEDLLRRAPNAFAAIVLEPVGPLGGSAEFLAGLRALCDHYGVVLVFDEIVTGFRLHMGGAQAYYGVTPDLACFGKAMANGMPISAIVGRRHIMRRMEDIFFSGTFSGEALSLAASLATLAKLERADAVARIHAVGKRLLADIRGILQRYQLLHRVSVEGMPWHPVVRLSGGGAQDRIISSILRQELIANGVLGSGVVNLALAHDDERVLTATVAAWDSAAAVVREAVAADEPRNFLRGEPIEPVFQVRPN